MQLPSLPTQCLLIALRAQAVAGQLDDYARAQVDLLKSLK